MSAKKKARCKYGLASWWWCACSNDDIFTVVRFTFLLTTIIVVKYYFHWTFAQYGSEFFWISLSMPVNPLVFLIVFCMTLKIRVQCLVYKASYRSVIYDFKPFSKIFWTFVRDFSSRTSAVSTRLPECNRSLQIRMPEVSKTTAARL